MSKEGAPDLVQKGLMYGGVRTVPLRETVRSVKLEGVVDEGVIRVREVGSDAEKPEAKKRNTEKP